MYGMTDSDYMRFLLSQKPEDYPEIRQMLSELINEVNHIGNNINQIARKKIMQDFITVMTWRV